MSEETELNPSSPCGFCGETGRIAIDFDGNTEVCSVCGGLGEL